MSTTSYLNNLLKSDLTEFAETSKLSDYASLKKADLADKLDGHLRQNVTTYSQEPTLAEYYRRMGGPTRSPVKRIAEKVSDIVKSDDDSSLVAVKKSRRATRSPDDVTIDSANNSLMQTPGNALDRRTSILAGSMPHPPSPAVVTDAIERQSKRIRHSISHAYEQTGVSEYTERTRDYLSSTVTINVLAILLEALGLQSQLLPFKTVTEIGPIAFFKDTPTKIKLPDLFLLLTEDFWAPFSLWILATLVLPAAVSYFINLPLVQLPAHSPARRASIKSNPHIQFDPFVFNLAKGLVVYLLFGLHFQFIELFTNATIAKVNTSIPGGYHGVLVSSGLGAAVSLYEAVLKK